MSQHTICALVAGFVCFTAACSGDNNPGDLAGAGGTPEAGGSASGGALSGGAPAAGGTLAIMGGTESGGALSGGAPSIGGDSPSSGGDSIGGNNTGGSSATLSLTSPAVENVDGCSVDTPLVCAVFPDENVSYMDNANISPELHWTGAPPGTQSFALVLFDVTYGQAHWALWNIPADTTMLAANVPQDTANPVAPAGSQQANANFATTSEDGYFGPHIPCNVFEFQLYALSVNPFSPMRPDSAVLISIELEELGDEEVLGMARLTARANDYDADCE